VWYVHSEHDGHYTNDHSTNDHDDDHYHDHDHDITNSDHNLHEHI